MYCIKYCNVIGVMIKYKNIEDWENSYETVLENGLLVIEETCK
jgi:hypothetical protein